MKILIPVLAVLALAGCETVTMAESDVVAYAQCQIDLATAKEREKALKPQVYYQDCRNAKTHTERRECGHKTITWKERAAEFQGTRSKEYATVSRELAVCRTKLAERPRVTTNESVTVSNSRTEHK